MRDDSLGSADSIQVLNARCLTRRERLERGRAILATFVAFVVILFALGAGIWAAP